MNPAPSIRFLGGINKFKLAEGNYRKISRVMVVYVFCFLATEICIFTQIRKNNKIRYDRFILEAHSIRVGWHAATKFGFKINLFSKSNVKRLSGSSEI